jgi:hypothetical protein
MDVFSASIRTKYCYFAIRGKFVLPTISVTVFLLRPAIPACDRLGR